MRQFAFISAGRVDEIVPYLLEIDGKQISLENRIHSDIIKLYFVEIPAGLPVEPGWYYQQGMFRRPNVDGSAPVPIDIDTITPRYDTTTLEGLKTACIAGSKANLSAYLATHPLLSACHGDTEKSYTATFEKQSLFTSKFTAHTVKVQAGLPDIMTWNTTGGECEPWTGTECVAFIIAMDAYVTPLVARQQQAEIAIREAETVEAVNAVDITFGEDINETPV